MPAALSQCLLERQVTSMRYSVTIPSLIEIMSHMLSMYSTPRWYTSVGSGG